MQHRHPIHCIVPPHMLEEIGQRGTPTQRALAVATIAVSNDIRANRFAVASRGRGPGVIPHTKDRYVHDAQQGSVLPGALGRKENDPPVADAAINEAYDGAGATFDMYSQVFGRNSIDNNGMKLVSTVHYQKGYDNAFWNGKQMVYGDGDENVPEAERLFNRFTASIDVIGHELAHGVTQYEARLIYNGQSGALNESMSDVFGSLVKQRVRGETADKANWIIGEGLFTSKVKGLGIRSMKAPGTAYDDPVLGKDPQPGHIKDYVSTAKDNGGVHVNSGIPNHAFYIAAIEIGGFAWEKAGRVWYKALTEKLAATATFQDAANSTHQAAGELYGANSLEQLALKKAWAEVGITVGAPSTGIGCMTTIMKILSGGK